MLNINEVLFSAVYIGGVFKAHNSVWVKTGRTAATTLGPKECGTCNFMLDGKAEDGHAEIVQELDAKEVGTLIYKHIKV